MMPVRITDRDHGWAQLLKDLRSAGKLAGKAGVIGPKAAEERSDGKGGSITNAEIALLNEFGSHDGHTPERSFIRAPFDANRGKYEDRLAAYAKQVYARSMKLERAVGLVTAEMASDIRKAVDGLPLQNAPSTIAHKGSSRPLVESSQMKDAISSAVVRGGKE